MHELTFASATITATVLEAGLYGSYTLIFATCIYIIHTKRVALHRPLTSTAIISFALSTVCIVINTYKMYSGYSAVPGGGGAVLSYVPSDPNDTTNHAKDYVFNINGLLADAVMVWRCYTVWNRDLRICIVLVTLWVGTSVTSLLSMWYTIHDKVDDEVRGRIPARMSSAALALSISTNAVATILIAWRIWYQLRYLKKTYGTRTRHIRYYWFTIIVVLESGAIYTLALIFDLAAYATNNTAAIITVAILDQIVGIVPTSIIILSALGRKYRSTETTNIDINTMASIRSANVLPPLNMTLHPGVDVEDEELTL